MLPPDGHANTTSAVTDVTSDSKFPSDIAEKNKAHFESLKDRAIEITDKQGVWLPKGFFSGPSNNDIFFHQMKLVFGEPVSHVLRLLNGTSDSNASTKTVTLGTLYAKIMNSIGIIIIIVTLVGSSLLFMFKRSMDISYLTVDKEESLPFLMARGSIGSLITFPIPALGGMSLLQGITIFIILIGLGAATATIKISVPYTLSPGMAYQPQPKVARFVDYILEAKTCSIAMGLMDGVSPDAYKGMDNVKIDDKGKYRITPNQEFKIYKHVAYFGANGNGDCGQLTLFNYQTPNSLDSLEDILLLTSHQVGAEKAGEYLNKIWKEPLIHNIAKKLTTNNLNNMEELAKKYAVYRERMQDEMIGDLSNELKDRLNQSSSPLNGSSLSSVYAEAVADVGFMGLGGFYTMLSVRQMEITMILSDIYGDREQPHWRPNTTDSIFAGVVKWFKSFGHSYDNLEIPQKNILMFYNSAQKYSLNNDIQNIMNSSMDKFTTTQLAQSMGQNIIEIIRSDSNGVYFPNPLVEMRTIGNVIINTAFTYAAVSVASSITPAGTVMKEGLNQIGGAAIDFEALAEKGGAMSAALILSLLGIGVFYSYIVPNIPYIMWSVAVFSFFSYAMGSIISSGWWGGAMALNDPQNERTFGGRFQEGANIILTLLIRPTLMTMCFFLAMILNIALGYYLHWTLEAASVSASYGGFNFLAILGTLFVNAIVMTAGIIKNHSLIWELPDQFQRMLSFRNAIEDNSHDSAMSTSQQMSGTLAGNVSTVTQSMLKNPVKGV